ncbi:MAG: 3'-5' exonuclease domain-containing protein 2 [Cyclobacteriaceae bacterium]|nr:3'-5' exonuclease domain-containing protein 2 [Cyclobacteriaceae bacterium]
MYKPNITSDEINDLPLKSFKGKIEIVTSLKEHPAIFKKLKKHDAVGFDTETKPTFKKGITHDTAMVQIATPKNAWLFRINQSGISDEMLDLMENNRMTKIGVALDDDLIALKRMREFEPAGFMSLEKEVKPIGIESNGLKKLVAIILNFRISKSAQVSNWESEELTDKQKTYAATDAWVCIQMYKELRDKGFLY